jgi:heavy metal translocating P-type ATPase
MRLMCPAPALIGDTQAETDHSPELAAALPDSGPTAVGRPSVAIRAWRLVRAYPRPFLMLVGLLVSLALDAYRDGLGDPLALVIIVVGAAPLIRDTITALREHRYALDYLALLAIAAAVAALELQVGAVIALMLASGQALEDYGVRRARTSLSLLADRIPRTALVLREGEAATPTAVEDIAVGSEVLVRHGEVLPLDGELLSDRALVDESSLTGEPYLLDKVRGDHVRSGTVNQGPPLRLRVLREARDSTYRQILELVESAQESSAPMARLADRYSLVFSAVAIALASGAWWYSGSLERALAVLVVATPCPLILGVPIALMGGVNRAARDKVIVKRLAGLEVLAKLSFLMLDKTGTITVGRPELVRIEPASDGAIDRDQLLCLTAAVERHSLHPIAKSLVEAAQARSLPLLEVQDVTETAGEGISAQVGNQVVAVHGGPAPYGQMRVVCEVDGKVAGTFVLEDRLKPDAREIFERILSLGVQLAIATGDRRNAAERVVDELGLRVEIDAECTPAFKLELIRKRQADGHVVGMVGDGINDAPALAQADVGLVFSHEARTASSEAADIVLLGGELKQVWQSVWIARQTIRVATQGILLGIGLSVVAMLAAAAGYLPPLAGALLQEGIDVLVIANALRATRGPAGSDTSV